MSNHAFLLHLKDVLHRCGCAQPVLRLPQKIYLSNIDITVSGQGADAQCTEALQADAAIGGAIYVQKARALNIRFTDAALYGAITAISPQNPPADSALQARSDDLRWDNPFYAVRYAHLRANSIAKDDMHWEYDPQIARQLAMAIVLMPDALKTCEDSWELLEALAQFAVIYARWHENLLVHRAAKYRPKNVSETNGDLMQKEAIQYPISSALLARAAAISLQCGLQRLSIEPTKDWVA